jgi:hypothetical protein
MNNVHNDALAYLYLASAEIAYRGSNFLKIVELREIEKRHVRKIYRL